MSFAENLFQRPVSDYSGNAEGPAPASRPLVLVMLFLACFAARALMSLTWDVLWVDGVIYLKACQFLEQGDFDGAFKGQGLNVYPAILLMLRRLGLEWSAAAVWWSVLMSSLVVLPLFGWVRRQFDDRVALLACVLYILHPKLLGFSPLTIRDPTFWFLFTLTLYLLWRAVTELRWWTFVSGGVTLILACLTRTEGWLLLVPLVLWPVGRFPAAGGKDRLRLAGGTVLSLAMIPLLLVAVNLTLLRNHSRWEFGYNRCIAHAVKLVGELNRADAGEAEKPARPEAAASRTERSDTAKTESEKKSAIRNSASLIGKVGSRLVKAFTYAYGLLAIIGLWYWRRVFMRREHQTILAMNLLLLVVIGMRYSLDGIDVRYYLPIIIVGCPFMALGLLQAVQWVVGLLFGDDGGTPRRRTVVGVGLLAVIVAVGSFNIFPVARSTMYEHAHLGKWILDRFGPGQKVIGSRRQQSLVEYYGQAEVLSCPNFLEYSSEPLLPLLKNKIPDVVLLWRSWRHDDDWQPYREKILDRQEELGYHEIPPDSLPASCTNVKVLLRNDKRLK
ncbi:MAG: glycosyltransferase family 39 protein [Thermoguttaceae bacterium]